MEVYLWASYNHLINKKIKKSLIKVGIEQVIQKYLKRQKTKIEGKITKT